MVLRIEDTDRERSTDENVAQILDALRWLELDWDEGPISQAERRRAPPRADRPPPRRWPRLRGRGRSAPAGPRRGRDRGPRRDPRRDRVPPRLHRRLRDRALGRQRPLQPRRVGRRPRHGDHPRHPGRRPPVEHPPPGDDHGRARLRAAGLRPPSPLHGPDGKKLSKRHGAASVQALRDAGYLPEAVRNYIALLGWGLDASTTFLSTDQLIEGFSLDRVSKSPAVFDEQKLRWMNGRYLRELATSELAARLEALTGRDGLEPAAAVAQEKMQTLADFWPLAGFLVEPQPTDEKAWAKVMDDGARERLGAARDALSGLDDPWTSDAVEEALRGVVETLRAQAPGGLPAVEGRDRGEHGLARDLRVSHRAGARGHPRAGRCRRSPASLQRRSGFNLPPGLPIKLKSPPSPAGKPPTCKNSSRRLQTQPSRDGASQ